MNTSKFSLFFQNDSVILSVLLLTTIITRFFLIINAPFVYDFDSYIYLSQSINFVSSGNVAFSTGMPFIICMGSFQYVLGSWLDVISSARLLEIMMSVIIVSLTYFFGEKISGKLFGFLVALATIFDPLFLSYSIVPHNDVFTIALGFSSLYFLFSKNKYKLILSLVFFYVAALTRLEFFVVFLFPISIYFLMKLLNAFSFIKLFKSAIFLLAFTVPAIWVSLQYDYVTRFGIIEKFSLFLKPDLFHLTLTRLFNFYDNPIFNNIFFVFILLGILLAILFSLRGFFVINKNNFFFTIARKPGKNFFHFFFSNQIMIVFSFLILFVIHIVVLTVYAYTYTIVDGTLIITSSFPDRYLILSRLILCYPFAYVMYVVLKVFYREITRKQ